MNKFLFTESFLKHGNNKDNERRSGDGREGRKRERWKRENEGQSRKCYQPVFSGSWLYLEKNQGRCFVLACDISLPSLVLDSSEQSSRQEEAGMLSPSKVTVQEQVLVL